MKIKEVWNKSTNFIANLMGVKRKTLLWAVIFAVLVFLGQTWISYGINQKLDQFQLKPDIDIELSPFLYNSQTFGEYLPLIVTNTGDFTLKNIMVFVSTCEMLDKNGNFSNYQPYTFPLIPAHAERTAPFAENLTITGFKKLKCYPFSDDRFKGVSISFTLGDTKNVTSSGYLCGYCSFRAYVFANYTDGNIQRNFKKQIDSEFTFPYKLTETISPIP